MYIYICTQYIPCVDKQYIYIYTICIYSLGKDCIAVPAENKTKLVAGVLALPGDIPAEFGSCPALPEVPAKSQFLGVRDPAKMKFQNQRCDRDTAGW